MGLHFRLIMDITYVLLRVYVHYVITTVMANEKY
jgi:hypothetical protein